MGMVDKRSWEEFRDNGFFWFVNTILHMFGWALAHEDEDGKIVNVYPARVKFRGFPTKTTEKGYKKVTQFMHDHADELLEEASDISDDDN